MINIYSFFHLNILFSSIEKEQRREVIQKCYWPLLNLVKENDIPIAIEAPAITLQIINKYDPYWIKDFKSLLEDGKCEFIGSGYTQLIGPLVPWEINKKNQLIGKEIYKKLLGYEPSISLINEQAFSSNLIPIYLDAGYKSIIMEWNNSLCFKDWETNLSYFRQKALSQCGKEIDLVWNNSINFQRFQRYVYSEINFNEFIELINKKNICKSGNYILYGSDAEIFNFRPGRFSNESKIQNCEWSKIRSLFLYFKENENYNFIFPSQVEYSTNQRYKKSLILNSVQQPIIVKKQPKYNIFRWGLTGRNDLEINTKCYEIFKRLNNRNDNQKEKYLKKLCYLWSSDFRTHITLKRWNDFLKKLDFLDKKTIHLKSKNQQKKQVFQYKKLNYKLLEKFIIVSYGQTCITFNINKGLAIESFVKSDINTNSIFGTIKHGTFNDINYSADFYSGNLNFQSPGKPQVTDMEYVSPEIICSDKKIILKANINTSNGIITKEWTIDSSLEIIKLRYFLDWPNANLGKMNIVPLTLNPYFFKNDSLFFEASNGSKYPEKFHINVSDIDHTKNVSFLVSSYHGMGMTNGKFLIGDQRNNIEVYFEPSKCAFLGQILHKKIDEINFTRFILTAREFDDTAKYNRLLIDTEIFYKINISL